MSLLRDEKGHWSAARCFCLAWLAQSAAYVWVFGDKVSNAALALDSGVAIALISWAAGPRIAQYLAPQVGAATAGVGQAIRDAIAKRRNVAEGHEVTK